MQVNALYRGEVVYHPVSVAMIICRDQIQHMPDAGEQGYIQALARHLERSAVNIGAAKTTLL
jgi:hypothetical protein